MKKILFINSLYTPHIGGGAEIIFQEQVEGFRRIGYDVVVATTDKRKGLHKDYVNEIPVYRVGIENLYWHFAQEKSPNKYIRLLWHMKDRYNSKMRQYIKTIIELENPDIAICHNITGFSISIWDGIKAAKLPIVQVLHDLYLLCTNSNMFRNEHTCEHQCTICHYMRNKHVIKSQTVDAVIGVSNYILNKFKANGYFKNVPSHVIYNAREIAEPSTQLVWDGGTPLRIGYIGTLSRVKGVEWLISQFMKLNIDATLEIAGKGESIEYENYLKDLASGDKRIHFLGYTKSEEFYQKTHVLVVPSLWDEPLGLVAIEACANNIPVITSARGGLKEIIKDGYNGLYCDANLPDSLSRIIKQIYNDHTLLNQLQKSARKSVISFLNPALMFSVYENIYRQITNSKNHV